MIFWQENEYMLPINIKRKNLRCYFYSLLIHFISLTSTSILTIKPMDEKFLRECKIVGKYHEQGKPKGDIIPLPPAWKQEAYIALEHCGIQKPDTKIRIHGLINYPGKRTCMFVINKRIYVNMAHPIFGRENLEYDPCFYRISRQYTFYHEAVHCIDTTSKNTEFQEVRADLEGLLTMDRHRKEDIDYYFRHILQSEYTSKRPYLSPQELLYHGLAAVKEQRKGQQVNITKAVTRIIEARRKLNYKNRLQARVRNLIKKGTILSAEPSYSSEMPIAQPHTYEIPAKTTNAHRTMLKHIHIFILLMLFHVCSTHYSFG